MSDKTGEFSYHFYLYFMLNHIDGVSNSTAELGNLEVYYFLFHG